MRSQGFLRYRLTARMMKASLFFWMAMTSSSDALPERQPYPLFPLKDVAHPVTDYTVGDVRLELTASGEFKVSSIASEDEIQAMRGRDEGATSKGRVRHVVLRLNEKLAAPLLVAWLSTPPGQHALNAVLNNGLTFGPRGFSWTHLSYAQVPVPPRDVQADQCQLLQLIGWVDEHKNSLERLVATVTKMRHAMVGRIATHGAEPKEVRDWLLPLVAQNPLKTKREAEPSSSPLEPASKSHPPRRRTP